NAPTINFALDIVEIDGRPIAKRGKMAGAKDIWSCRNCYHAVITVAGQEPQKPCPHCGSSSLWKATVPLMRKGQPVVEPVSATDLRKKVLEVLPKLEPIAPPPGR
ncbi:MAG: nicotinate phosphoribosyltransferase, partial [Armatimonadetes bacterium]|nr:nicotinate phosphoribosyltransferase [Armatimonadota bacterium]MDW8121608.1 nicotinate phosphoribosyltransferase [Armatimonadota bacterium]